MSQIRRGQVWCAPRTGERMTIVEEPDENGIGTGQLDGSLKWTVFEERILRQHWELACDAPARANDGGDVVFMTGHGQLGEPLGLHNGNCGAMYFKIGPTEHLRIEPDGKFYVQNRFIAEDSDVYRAFTRWLAEATAHWGPDAFTVKGD